MQLLPGDAVSHPASTSSTSLPHPQGSQAAVQDPRNCQRRYGEGLPSISIVHNCVCINWLGLLALQSFTDPWLSVVTVVTGSNTQGLCIHQSRCPTASLTALSYLNHLIWQNSLLILGFQFNRRCYELDFLPSHGFYLVMHSIVSLTQG